MTRVVRHPSIYILGLLVICLALFPGYSYYRHASYQSIRPAYRDLPAFFVNRDFALYPARVGEVGPPDLSAEGVFVIDVDSAVPIYEKNSNKILYPASTTKMMTALVARDLYDLDDVVTVPEATYSGSTMKLFPRERITVRSLLYGLLINSGNDAAEVLAAHHPGGREGFLNEMNNKAQGIGLRSTTFKNPSGLPESGHESSAWDLGQIAVLAMRDETIRSIVRQQELTVYGLGGERHVLKTTNKLLGTIPGLDGVKTGYTDEAGEVLVSSVMRNNHRVIVVLLKSKDRFAETRSIVDWVFRNHEWTSVEPSERLLNR